MKIQVLRYKRAFGYRLLIASPAMCDDLAGAAGGDEGGHHGVEALRRGSRLPAPVVR